MALNVAIEFKNDPHDRFPGVAVHRYEMSDGLSSLFELKVLLASTDPTVDLRSLMGEPVTVTFADEPHLPAVHGIIREVQTSAAPGGGGSTATFYELAIVPPLWLTTRRRDHRIFQNSSIPDVVAAVLNGYSHRIPDFASTFINALEVREYVVQYGETDHDFIFRLLAEQHITTFFDHGNASTWTLIDDTTSFTPQVTPAFPFEAGAPGQNAPKEHVFGVTTGTRIETSTVSLRNSNDNNPKIALEGTHAAPAASLFTNEADLEQYFYQVGRFQDGGDELATSVLRSIDAEGRSIRCDASFAVGAGSRLFVKGHPSPNVAPELLVVRVSVVSDDGVRAQGLAGPSIAIRTFECIHALKLWFPSELPKPRVHGTQTAFVVGDFADGEVDVDKLGRVKVEFRWDRRDRGTGNPTRFVRISQGWAGAGYGFVTLPRIGDEVIVAYLDGDPNEPIIVGRVHNVLTKTPLDLPQQDKTLAVWRSKSFGTSNGFNRILMDDAGGAERLELRAERDFKSETTHDSTTVIGNDEKVTVKGNQSVSITGRRDVQIRGPETTTVTGDKHISANLVEIEGTQTVSLKSGQSVTAWAPLIQLVAGGSILSVFEDRIEVTSPKVDLKGGDSQITLEAGSVTISSSGVILMKAPLIDLNP